MSIISKIKSLFESFEGRHQWIPERLEHAATLASEYKYQAEEIAEIIVANTVPGDEWGPQTTENLNFDCAKFCVNWISQLADGTNWLVKIGLDENHAWYVREEAFLCIAHLKPTDILEDDWSTDARYHLEQEMTIGYQEEQATADRNQLIDALQTAGIAVTSVQDCGEYNQQGSGTYWVLGLGNEANSNQLYVSTLGKFVSYVDVSRRLTATSYGESYNIGPKEKEIKDKTQVAEQRACKKVAHELGFAFLDGECLQLEVPGLSVYLFGHDKPPIGKLLYYWTS